MKNLLSLGWIIAFLFIVGSLILGYLLPDYDLVSQTLSEIGEDGSPFYTQWMLVDGSTAVLSVLFGLGIIWFSKGYQLPYLPGLFLLCFGLLGCGAIFFASPHPLHNVFGLLNIVGYFSPLVFFFRWKDRLGEGFRSTSLLVFILIVLGTFLNLAPLFASIVDLMPYYGLVQRFVVFTFYFYCAYLSFSMLQYMKESEQSPLLNI